jgi:hypothetical protein
VLLDLRRTVVFAVNRYRGLINEIDILWITADLGCDGDTIAMTAATQPSIEDVVLGSLPGIPKVHPRLRRSVNWGIRQNLILRSNSSRVPRWRWSIGHGVPFSRRRIFWQSYHQEK